MKSYIGNLFPHADIPNGISPDEVFAYGAAVQAGFLAKYWNLDNDLPEPTTEIHTLKEPIVVDVGIYFILQFKHISINLNIYVLVL